MGCRPQFLQMQLLYLSWRETLLEGLNASYVGKTTLQELATFDGMRTISVVWSEFNYVSNYKCSQHCSHLGNDCPIIIVKGEADREYTSRVLA
jgi:hypothetical protein